MKDTFHKIIVGDSRNMEELDDESIQLVVTSPPYPMIEMWDECYSELNEEIKTQLERENGEEAFQLMHEELDKTWNEVKRVLSPGGIVCINIGDATRKIGRNFQLFPNHIRVLRAFNDNEFTVLPDILWRKPTNKANKFMGSGMLPPNAYVTLEHEYILILRKGGSRREFKPKSQNRYESAYFWEERNKWFSDVWTEIKGTLQELNNNELRDRAGAFPLELPYRLINMYSVYGDTVLDPFWGTGTTTLASMICGRNSVGYEIEEGFKSAFEERLRRVGEMSEEVNKKRIENHREFVASWREGKEWFKYYAENYDFPVMTKQERKIQLYDISEVKSEDGLVRVTYKEHPIQKKLFA